MIKTFNKYIRCTCHEVYISLATLSINAQRLCKNTRKGTISKFKIAADWLGNE